MHERRSRSAVLDSVFFVIAAGAAVWLAVLLIEQDLQLSWNSIWLTIVFWLFLAYLLLPRIHQILTALYVPDYFIGRTRTSDGLLGDPVNIGLLGTEAQVHEALLHAGWTRADDLSLRSGVRIVSSTLRRVSYDEAPVSPLLLFGRQQDFAYQQEVEGNPAKRHHVRFWRAPEGWRLPGGTPIDWLAAGTFDRRVGFSLFTLQVTHKIQADTDQERDFIVRSLEGANPAITVRVIRDFSSGYHARNGGGDAIVTDGDLPIVEPTALPRTDEAAREPTDSRLRRPWSTVAGALLILLRVAFGVLPIIEIATEWPNLVAGGTAVEQAAVAVVFGIVLGVTAGAVLLDLLFGIFVFTGTNWARIGVMTVATVSLLVEFALAATGGEAIRLDTSLIGVAIDILVLLALSNPRARDWARRRQGATIAADVRNARHELDLAGDAVKGVARDLSRPGG